MPEVKHTPGPWWWESDHTHRSFLIRADRKDDRGLAEHICTTNNLPEQVLAGRDPAQALANARLIAAAPEMLEALKRLMPGLCSEDGTVYDRDLEDRVVAARATIAKAEGRL